MSDPAQTYTETILLSPIGSREFTEALKVVSDIELEFIAETLVLSEGQDGIMKFGKRWFVGNEIARRSR